MMTLLEASLGSRQYCLPVTSLAVQYINPTVIQYRYSHHAEYMRSNCNISAMLSVC